MKFRTETERQQHPQASLIPYNLWIKKFQSSLREDFIPLMQADVKDYLTALERLPISDLSIREKECALLLIALSHPQLSPDALNQIAIQLHLPDTSLFETAVWVGNRKILEYLADKDSSRAIETMIAADDFYAFRTAAENGQLQVLEYLEGKVSPQQLQEMIAAGGSDVFCTAAQNGHLQVLKYLESKISRARLKAMIAAGGSDVFCTAAKNGHLHILEYLEERVTSTRLKAMIAAGGSDLFCTAAKNGHLHILEYLESKLSSTQWQAMIAAGGLDAFRTAAENGHLQVLKYLEGKAPAKLQAMIATNDFHAFRLAAENGHLQVMEYLEDNVSPAQLQDMIAANGFHAFRTAAENGHLQVMKDLASKIFPEQLQEMVAAGDFHAFRFAASQGHLQVMEYLAGKVSPMRLIDMIGADGFHAFRTASGHGHLQVLEYLANKISPAQLQDMIAANDFQVFRLAAENGHLEVLQYLIGEISPKKLQAMIAADDFQAFRLAAENGHLEVLQYLIGKISPEKLQAMIAAGGFHAFRAAAENGHLQVVKYLAKVFPEQLEEMIAAGDFHAFRFAASHGHLEVLQYLERVSPTQWDAMIAANGFQGFRTASENGHLQVLKYLEGKVLPKQLQEMIAADDFQAFRLAASHGHLQILKYLEEKVPSEQLQTMIAAGDFHAFRFAASHGYLQVLKYLEGKIFPEQWQAMIAAKDFYAFRFAASHGQLDILKYLVGKVHPAQLQTMIAAEGSHAFRFAASHGHLNILEYLEDKVSPVQLQAMIAAKDYDVFVGDPSNIYALEYLDHKIYELWQNLIPINVNFSIKKAIENGHLQVLKYLAAKAPEKLQAVIDLGIFCTAAENGHVQVLEYLADKIAPAQLQDYIFSAFHRAAHNGQIQVLEYLESKSSPTQLQAMIAANNFHAFHRAADHGQIQVLEYLESKASPPQLQAMIAANNFHAFRSAAEHGQLQVLENLAGKVSPAQLEAMIAANNFHAFRWAANNGHLPIINHLLSHPVVLAHAEKHVREYKSYITPYITNQLGMLQSQKRAIEANDPHAVFDVDLVSAQRCFYILRHLIRRNDAVCLEDIRFLLNIPAVKNLAHTAVSPGEPNELLLLALSIPNAAGAPAAQAAEILLNLPAGLTPEKLQTVIDDHKVFHAAAENGHLQVLEYLESNSSSTQLQAMIAANNFHAFRSAALRGQLQVLENLEGKVSPAQLQAMLAVYNFDAFRWAASNGHLPVINHLLSHPVVLAHAEEHVREYERYITPYITTQLGMLQSQKQALEANDPHAVFDVDLVSAQRCFYILRHLIRRNDAASLDDIRFLLNIPAVKNLAHTAVSPGQPNELLRLALRISHDPRDPAAQAAEILLNLPEVRARAQRDGYYRNEAQGGLDLGALARNRESSMTALSSGEQKRLKKALDHYNPLLKKEAAVPNLITALKGRLEERYNDQPAQIEIERNGEKIKLDLPMSWNEFLKLNLSAAEKETAFIAYYKHKDHTAWRYLSKPNPWMHSNADYVYISDDRRERWSTFEEYQPLIAMLFLAVIDEEIPPIDDFTLDTRLEHFIGELALIGRAHNWDKTRIVTDDDGNLILDDEGNPREEEYDDLKGDRPSCFSGVKRRLFQSVLGHPLLKMLTADVIKREIRDFVRQQFIKTIAKNNSQDLLKAWEQLLEGDQTAIAALKVLDIPKEEQQQFKDSLAAKYESQYTEDTLFDKQVDDAFALRNPEVDCHAVNFGYVNLEELLLHARPAEVKVSASRSHYFASQEKSKTPSHAKASANPSSQESNHSVTEKKNLGGQT